MNIIFLYTEVMGYTEGVLAALLEHDAKLKLTVVYWDAQTLSNHQIVHTTGVIYIPRSKLKGDLLGRLLETVKPELIYISGWMDRGYVKAIKKQKAINSSTIVVMGSDNQWFGTLRQRIGKYYLKYYLHQFVDYFWISGSPQYHYAKQLGFSNEKIVHNLLSANTYLLDGLSTLNSRFVYLGRLSAEKGILELVRAYNLLPEESRKKWPLVVIGDGPLKEKIESIKCAEIELKGFMQGASLNRELLKGGVYVAPSHIDGWGVSIHEMVLWGYPLIATKYCGAATEFLIHGYNGFLIDSSDVESILLSLKRVLILDIGQLSAFSKRSVVLGNRINSDISAASLLSVTDR